MRSEEELRRPTRPNDFVSGYKDEVIASDIPTARAGAVRNEDVKQAYLYIQDL